jgi:hypothetical protein
MVTTFTRCWVIRYCVDLKYYLDLVVIVFLRFGSAGKEAAPLAAKMIHKWREIQAKYRE